MAGPDEHGRTVLSAVLAGRGTQDTRVLDYAAARLTEGHFTDRVQARLYRLCLRYADAYRAVLPRKVLADLLRGEPPGTALAYGEYYDALCAGVPSADEFRLSVDQLVELALDRATGDALAQGMQILGEGAYEEDGAVFLRGHAAARAHVMSAFAAAERDAGNAQAPEGDARREKELILGRYARAKELRARGESPGVKFGIAGLDRKLKSGVTPGSLSVVLGWTSAGKTSFCVQWAWHVSVVQGRDVVYFTTETLRPQIIAKLIARHSRLPRFGLPRGLDSDDILGGTLDAAQETALREVVADFSSGPYGRCWVAQCGRSAGVGTIESRLAAARRQFRPAMVFVDYAQLLSPERSYRESKLNVDLAGVVKDLKQVAAAFDGGNGVPVATPWQTTRKGRENLKTAGGYSLLDVAETKEAADTADLVVSLVDPEKDSSAGRAVPIEAAVLKNRLGVRNFSARLTADFATSYFGEDRTTSEDLTMLGGGE